MDELKDTARSEQQMNVTENDRKRLPILTISILTVTVIGVILGIFYPPVLAMLRRNLAGLAAGQWWRVITPLFVDPDPFWQIAIKWLGIGLVGSLMEQRLGSLRWLALYFLPGLVGEAAGYAWQPYGAGSSVALCGLIGGLFTINIMVRQAVRPAALFYSACLAASLAGNAVGGWVVSSILTGVVGTLCGMLLLRRRPSPNTVRIFGLGGLVAAVVLILFHDIHGPALLAGILLGGLLLWRGNFLPERAA